MSKTETAVSLMEAWARDDEHGYDQTYRWGEKGDFDCSSAVITAWETAGVPVKTNGATYTGNMYAVFTASGFKDVTSEVDLSNGDGLMRGDVLLNKANHTAMYCGNGKEVEASINENGTTSGGEPGDQTGREFLVRSYRNYPWDCVLRYAEGDSVVEKPSTLPTTLVNTKLPQIKQGNTGAAVTMMQAALKYQGYDPKWIDGEFGTYSHNMLMAFQAETGLEADGVCGPASWAALAEG